VSLRLSSCFFSLHCPLWSDLGDAEETIFPPCVSLLFSLPFLQFGRSMEKIGKKEEAEEEGVAGTFLKFQRGGLGKKSVRLLGAEGQRFLPLLPDELFH
jgi:hypothetical protein